MSCVVICWKNFVNDSIDFFFNFQEYSTAIEYYKLALASGLLKDLRTNLSTAKCYEKLGDLENAKLYYQICNHIDSSSKRVKEKINEYVQENTQDVHELENAKYKIQLTKEDISKFIRTSLKKEAELLIELLVKKIILYDDKIEIYYNYTDKKNTLDDIQGSSFYKDYFEQEITNTKFNGEDIFN